MKSLLEYQSYRKFMQDSFLQEKKMSRSVNLPSYAKKLGLSGSSLQMILSGQRNLTVSNIHSVARGFKMASSEHVYFETLVHFEQATDDESKSYYRSRLKSIKKDSVITPKRTSDRQLISEVLLPALLIYLIDIESVGSRKTLDEIDPEIIAKRFAISPAKMKSYLRTLQESGLIENPQAYETHLMFESVAGKNSEKDYFLAEVEALSQKGREGFSETQNFFRTFTLSMNKSDLPLLRADFFSLMERYMSRPLDPNKSMVVEKVVIGAYPVAVK